jgi:hypothetical protein
MARSCALANRQRHQQERCGVLDQETQYCQLWIFSVRAGRYAEIAVMSRSFCDLGNVPGAQSLPRDDASKAIVDFYACGTKTAKLAFRNWTLARQHCGTPPTGHSPFLAFLPDQMTAHGAA